MSFNVKINRVKLYINGKNAETIKGNLQIRIGKHASNEKKAVFYICDNNTRKKEFYIPVVESQYSDVTGKRDNSSFYFTFKMEENTNDYKCILQGSKKNLEEIQKYIENFDSSMLNQIPNNESPSAIKNNDENEMSNATNKKKRKKPTTTTNNKNNKKKNAPTSSNNNNNNNNTNNNKKKKKKKTQALSSSPTQNSNNTTNDNNNNNNTANSMHSYFSTTPSRTQRQSNSSMSKVQQLTPPQVERDSASRNSSTKRNNSRQQHLNTYGSASFLNGGSSSSSSKGSSRGKRMLHSASQQNRRLSSRQSAYPPVYQDNGSSNNSNKNAKLNQNRRPSSSQEQLFTGNNNNNNKNSNSIVRSKNVNTNGNSSYYYAGKLYSGGKNNRFKYIKKKKPTNDNMSLTRLDRGGGIVNLGNTCYMNAVLQSICACDGFVHDMKRKCLTKAATKGNIGIKENRLLYSGMISFVQRRNVALGKKERVNPTDDIREAVCKIFPSFNNTIQQDAQEFFVYALNRIHEELLLCKIVPPLSSSSQHHHNIINNNDGDGKKKQKKKQKNGGKMLMKSWLNENNITDERNFEYLPTTRHFHIEIKNALKCQNVNCMFTRGTLELFRNLSLHLPSTRKNRSLTMTELLDSFFNHEIVELRCDKCKGKLGACKSVKLHVLPNVLVLHFKRFEANIATGKFIKRRDYIGIDDVIDLAKYCEQDARNSPNDDLGPISKADSIEMKKLTKNDVKPATETSSATDENSNKKENTKNGGGLIGNKRISAVTPEDKKSGNNNKSSIDLTKSNGSSSSSSIANAAARFHTQISAARVDFLTPSKDTSKKKKQLFTKYKLKSIVHHHGFQAFSGHYTADVRADEDPNLWYRYDDTVVSKVDKSMTKTRDESSVYMAFYVLQRD